MDAVTQFSLFGAEAAAPALEDLDGLLLAGGQWVRSAAGARLSIVVADRWRADALAAAFAERALAGHAAPGDAAPGDAAPGSAVPGSAVPGDAVLATDTKWAVRTAFRTDLVAQAARWTRGARQGVPPGFQLGPGGLRLWAIAAGRRDGLGYLLATAEPDDPMHRIAGAQLARLNVTAVSLSQRPGPGWRITSARRLRRFAELVGVAPGGAGDDWP